MVNTRNFWSHNIGAFRPQILKRFKGKFSFKYTKQDNTNSLKDIIIRVPKDPKLNKGFVSVM